MAEAKLIDGKAHAAGLRKRVGAGVEALIAGGGPKPGLATVLIGEDPASQVYVRSKGKLAAELGMASFDHRLPESTTEAELLALIARLNADKAVHGILVQLPLPKHIDTAQVLLAVDPAKDVDGFHPLNVGRLGTVDSGAPLDFPVPCTPLGVSMLLQDALASLVRPARRGDRPLEPGRPSGGAAAAARRLHGDDRPFAHPRPAGARAARPTSWWSRSASPSSCAATGSGPARR